jgi:hypothetical protein
MLKTIKKESKKIREWAIKANGNSHLVNWCTICSYLIFKRLKARKLDPIFCSYVQYCGTCHCFVLCNGHIIDVTADQFGIIEEDIVIKNIKDVDKKVEWFWDVDNCQKFDNIVDIDKHLTIWDDICNPQKKFRQKAA